MICNFTHKVTVVNTQVFQNFTTKLVWSVFSLLAAHDAHSLQPDNPLKQITELPLALRQWPAATGACRRDDALFSADNPGLPTPAAKLDLVCGRNAKEASTLLASPDSMLVDLRTSTEYQNFHARDAINLTISELAVKSYLKNKNIILMGNGKLDGEVYRTCTFLKQVGYTSVFVFQGGVTNWMLSSYATVGNVTRAFDDIRLTPSELFIESREAENLIYLDPSRDDMFKYFPSASILTTVSSEKIKISLEAVKAKELLGLILIGARSLTIEQIRSLQQAALPRRLIVYSGSANDYQSFLNQQKKTWIAQVNGPKKLGCGL